MNLFEFHLDISGKEVKDLQLQNNPLIFWTLIVFHFEISGKDDKDEQL